MQGSSQSQPVLELSSAGWLLVHHLAKEAERRQMVDDLGLGPGDRVLDSASGPGLWCRLFAEKVFPSGKIVGLDFSPELIEYGRMTLKEDPLGEVTELALGDFNRLPFPNGTFDAVFLGNCFCYVEDIITLLKEHKQVTRTGGRVISKEFDGATVLFHPVDHTLTLRVLVAAAQALDEGAAVSTFDNFVGRKMHGKFLQAGFESVSTRSYPIQKVWPLSAEEKRYIQGNAGWYGRMADRHLSDEDRRRWAEAFDPASPEYVLDREDFFFFMLETVTVGVV